MKLVNEGIVMVLVLTSTLYLQIVPAPLQEIITHQALQCKFSYFAGERFPPEDKVKSNV
jgi:hypothetical protein